MAMLVLGLVVFLGMHSVRIVADGWRTRQVGRIGAGAWKGLYTLVSLAGFALLVWGFGLARAQPVVLYAPPPWLRALNTPLTLVAFVLVAAAYVPGNRLKARIGHPMLAGTKTWAFGHLLATGMLRDVILFGAFFLWAVAAFASARRRDRRAGVVYPQGALGRDLVVVVAGGAAWAVFALWLHARWIGVSPWAGWGGGP